MQIFNVCWLMTIVFFNSTSSMAHTLSKDALIEVESNLRSLFGFRRRPNIDRSKVEVPQAMLDLYKKQTGRHFDTASIPKPGLHTQNANTIRSFTHAESPIDARFRGHHRFRLKFDLAGIPEGERIEAAELILNRESIERFSMDDNAKENYQQVIINEVIRPGIKGKREPILRLIDTKRIDTRHNTSLSMDVLPAVARWLENPSKNYGLVVNIYGFGKRKMKPSRHIRLRRDVNDGERTWVKSQPLLLTYTDDGKNERVTGEKILERRKRRAANKKKRRREQEPCKRHPMYVDFTDVGWHNWIVAPPGYEAYYCHGECNFPFAEHMNTTNHAIVQTLMNSVNPSQVPKACCVPTQLSSISMLYLDDENKVVLKNYKEMSVVGCGCR